MTPEQQRKETSVIKDTQSREEEQAGESLLVELGRYPENHKGCAGGHGWTNWGVRGLLAPRGWRWTVTATCVPSCV